MMNDFPFQAAERIFERVKEFRPTLGIILGSGSADIAKQIEPIEVINYCDLPGFFECSVEGHQAQMVLGFFQGCPVVCLKGRAHYYEGYENETVQTLIRTLKLIGCETLFLTNAAASLKPEVSPGSLVLISDHINFQFKNPLVGKNDDRLGPRFPDLSNAYDLELRKIALNAAKKLGIQLAEGIYMGVLGPCYETPAEIRAFRTLGADLVGMSTVPEVIIARHCGLKVMGISIVTNLGSGLSSEILDHEEVLAIGQGAASKLALLLGEIVLNSQLFVIKN